MAQWPMLGGTTRKATFSVELHGKREAFNLAVAARLAESWEIQR